MFNASNLEVVTKTRVEHLRDEDKSKNSRVYFLNLDEKCYRISVASPSPY